MGATSLTFEEGRPVGGSEEQDVRVEEDHGSRVTPFRELQVIFGRRGAAAMASRQRSMLILGSGFGGSRRTRSRRPSPWLWMSKTSPGLAAGRTTRRLESAVEIAMAGLSNSTRRAQEEPGTYATGQRRAGMHLTAILGPGARDRQISEQAARQGPWMTPRSRTAQRKHYDFEIPAMRRRPSLNT